MYMYVCMCSKNNSGGGKYTCVHTGWGHTHHRRGERERGLMGSGLIA